MRPHRPRLQRPSSNTLKTHAHIHAYTYAHTLHTDTIDSCYRNASLSSHELTPGVFAGERARVACVCDHILPGAVPRLQVTSARHSISMLNPIYNL